MAPILTLHQGDAEATFEERAADARMRRAEVVAARGLVRDMYDRAKTVPAGSKMRDQLLDWAVRIAIWADEGEPKKGGE
jgi:hypothetical protein